MTAPKDLEREAYQKVVATMRRLCKEPLYTEWLIEDDKMLVGIPVPTKYTRTANNQEPIKGLELTRHSPICEAMKAVERCLQQIEKETSMERPPGEPIEETLRRILETIKQLDQIVIPPDTRLTPN